MNFDIEVNGEKLTERFAEYRKNFQIILDYLKSQKLWLLDQVCKIDVTVRKMHKMKITKLTEINLPYDPDEYNRWIERDFSVIDDRIPIHVRNFIKKKALNRKGKQKTRLFSEVMALNQYIDYAKDGVELSASRS